MIFSAGKENKTLFCVNSWITIRRRIRGHTGIETDVNVLKVHVGGSL